jgi:hypothetical protein
VEQRATQPTAIRSHWPFSESFGNIGAFDNASVRDGSFTKQSALEISTTNIGSSQVSLSQVSPNEITSGKDSFNEFSSNQLSSFKGGAGQVSINPTSSGQIGSNELTLNHFRFTESGSPHVISTEVTATVVSTGHTSTIDTLTNRTILLPTSSSTHVSIGNFNLEEIAFSSSIETEELIGSHFLNRHSFDLNNTTIPTWTEFLTGTTPFNLNIEITDLPTGQLAEANITRFDTFGRPTTGTLTHLFHRRFANDTDANGLGWF